MDLRAIKPISGLDERGKTKQYGTTPASQTGEQTDLGHSINWQAPVETARDIREYARNGKPTPGLFGLR